MSIPLVVVKQSLVANWSKDGAPGFEMEVNATYRDLPEEALIQIEKTLADGINKMATYGESKLAAGK